MQCTLRSSISRKASVLRSTRTRRRQIPSSVLEGFAIPDEQQIEYTDLKLQVLGHGSDPVTEHPDRGTLADVGQNQGLWYRGGSLRDDPVSDPRSACGSRPGCIGTLLIRVGWGQWCTRSNVGSPVPPNENLISRQMGKLRQTFWPRCSLVLDHPYLTTRLS